MSAVEVLDASFRFVNQRMVARHVFLWRLVEIRGQGEIQVRICVAEQTEVQLLQRPLHVISDSWKCSDDYHRSTFHRDGALACSWGKKRGGSQCAISQFVRLALAITDGTISNVAVARSCTADRPAA